MVAKVTAVDSVGTNPSGPAEVDVSTLLVAWGAGWTVLWGALAALTWRHDTRREEERETFGVAIVGLLASVAWLTGAVIYRWLS